MSNFSETYFYSSVLDNGELNEYGCGIKNVNDSKEYYIYDADSKNYTTVTKEQYIDYNDKMEKIHGDTSPLPPPPPHTFQPEAQQFIQRPEQPQPLPEECPYYTPPLTKKCPLTRQEQKQVPLTTKCPLTRQEQQQFKQRPWLDEECQCLSPPPQCCMRPPSPCCTPLRPPRPQLHFQYPLGGFVKRIPVLSEVDVLKRDNQKLRNLLKYYTSF